MIRHPFCLPVLLATTLLTACGSSGSTPSSSEQTAQENSPPPGTEATGLKLSCEEAKFVTLLNLYRTSQGRTTVLVSEAGVLASRWHGEDMIAKNYFSHTEPDGRSFSARTGSFGYSAWAENIAAGNSGALATFCQWKNSPGHDANMLSAQHRTIGIGRASGGGTYGVYWSNSFGPMSNDTIGVPLTADTACALPTALPEC